MRPARRHPSPPICEALSVLRRSSSDSPPSRTSSTAQTAKPLLAYYGPGCRLRTIRRNAISAPPAGRSCWLRKKICQIWFKKSDGARDTPAGARARATTTSAPRRC
eukprot:CAMPEP_0179893162 /NCGR_PEP_ID=MMETSP0982-20121206/34629_1 /TAXON_ID=483367 /ORGANISM="non described non described, Strain CCMP 2436" /LENGTH=105 /DNA_ID=CAMNT_0021789715 /DNA_START=296 /DNA_END=613 /DNA_ORIENTATION=-